jgi:hypothetical protein
LLPVSSNANVRVLGMQVGADVNLAGESSVWYAYRRLHGRRRGAYVGPFAGPDAALAYVRDAMELELLLLDDTAPSSSFFRIVRRLSV